ncbi:MAG: leucine-rich repeat protein [Alistipes sp.]|nr:leucine-rich repeat protein [Alistipes sp.]
MKRRSFLCLTALLCLVVLLLPLSVSAATVAEGTCGENLKWVLNDEGILTISGTGDMTNFEGEFMPWKQAKTVKKLVVEEGVTSIGDRAFEFFSNLKKVDLADSITYIGESAFSNKSHASRRQLRLL